MSDSLNDKMRVRVFQKLKFQDPSSTLMSLRELQRRAAGSNLPADVLNLRQGKQKKYRELRQAALFAYGMGQRLGVTVFVAMGESADYDAVCMWRTADQVELYAPIQLKELPPAAKNPAATLQEHVSLLEKYTDSTDLQVVIYLNRTGKIDPTGLKLPTVKLGGLWLVGATSPNQQTWTLMGDLLGDPESTEFQYPA